MDDKRCPVCKGPKAEIKHLEGLVWDPVNCQRCGTFYINEGSWFPLDTESGSETRPALLGPSGSRQRANLSGHIREHQGLKIEKQDVERLTRLETPSFHKRADKLLEAIQRDTKFAGQPVDVDEPRWRAIAWCVEEEFGEVLRYLVSTKRVQSTHQGKLGPVAIAPDGWAHLEKLHETNPTSSEGFVAMKFSDSMFSVYENAIAPAIVDAGYDPMIVPRFQPRPDTEGFTDDIVAKILMLVRRSRFVVADFSEPSEGVYFEAGYAKGLGRHVIWTRQKDAPGKPHFDTDHFDHIMWTDEDTLRQQLSERIEGQLGRGPHHRTATPPRSAGR